MAKQLTARQQQERSAGMAAYAGYQSYVNNQNGMLSRIDKESYLIQPDALSVNFFSGKIYAGPKNNSTPSGAANFKRTAKKLAAIRARASKRANR